MGFPRQPVLQNAPAIAHGFRSAAHHTSWDPPPFARPVRPLPGLANPQQLALSLIGKRLSPEPKSTNPAPGETTQPPARVPTPSKLDPPEEAKEPSPSSEPEASPSPDMQSDSKPEPEASPEPD